MILAAFVLAAQPHAHRPPPPPPKVEWMKQGEEIVRDPHGFDPETKYNKPDYSDPKVFQKDTFIWA